MTTQYEDRDNLMYGYRFLPLLSYCTGLRSSLFRASVFTECSTYSGSWTGFCPPERLINFINEF